MKVSLFITCMCDVISPKVGKDTIELLEKLGCSVDFPKKQTCCGQPAFNSGYLQDSKKAMKQMMEAFCESEYVVSPSGSCVSMFKQYPAIFKDDPKWESRARELAQKTYEITQFIVDILAVSDVGSSFQGKIAYHPSCHMTRLLGVKNQPLHLLENIKGATVIPIEGGEDCCGFGGLFSIDNPIVSGSMVEEKANHILDTEVDVLVGGDMACLMNIGGKIDKMNHPLKIAHITEVLNWTIKEGIDNEYNNRFSSL